MIDYIASYLLLGPICAIFILIAQICSDNKNYPVDRGEWAIVNGGFWAILLMVTLPVFNIVLLYAVIALYIKRSFR